ncbi:hypothetical protein J4526_08060 [Desulfurococcaceae archaeon MEX13E-LK6-19]|nr:hypothetical protein J4526_08060 [Desulfurococcaceae archaeon MEX13E-LK6-19]
MPYTSMKPLLLLFITTIIVLSLISPSTTALTMNTDSVEGIDLLKHALVSEIDVWEEALANEVLLNLILVDIIPPDGKYYDPLVERFFWETVIPSGVGRDEYTVLLFKYLIPSNFSNSYYYTAFFNRIITEGYRMYRLNREADPLVNKDSFLFYHRLLFAYLVPSNFSDGYYYDQVFYVLYRENKWGFAEVLAWIAYYNEFGPFYATILTKIDLEEQFRSLLTNWEPGEPVNLAELTQPGKLHLELYGPTGPLQGVYVVIYDETLCDIGYCYSDRVSYGLTNGSGVVEFELPPGVYRAKLYGAAYGEIHDIRVETNKTTNVTELLGKLTIVFTDSSGNGIPGLSFTLYEQILSSGGIVEQGSPIASLTLDANGSISFYIVEGRYMARPYLPGHNTYFKDIIANAGVEHTYVFNLDVRQVTIRAVTPIPSMPFYFSYRIYGPVPGVPYTYTYTSNYEGVATIWLKPGEYAVEVTEVSVGNLDIEASILINFTVDSNSEVSVEIPFSVVAVNITGILPETTLRFNAWRLLDDGSMIRVRNLGSIDLGQATVIPLPKGTYYFELVAGWGSQKYNFTVTINPVNSVYNVALDIPVGYLNLSTIPVDGGNVRRYYSVYLQETIGNITYYTDYVGTGLTGSLTPLLPGNYTVIINDIGLAEPIYNIVITEGVITYKSIHLGRIVVNVTTFNYMGTSVPILVFPYNTTSGEPVWNTLVYSTYTSGDGIAVIDIVPGTYAVAIPGENITFYWWTKIGYGEVVLNLTVDTVHTVNVSFSLGKLLVNLNPPYDYRAYIDEDYFIYILEQKTVNGTPVYGDVIKSMYIWSLPMVFDYDLTQGVYAIGIGSYYGVFNDTVIYNVAISPNGITNISYNFGIIQIQVLLDNGEPVSGLWVELYTSDGYYLGDDMTEVDGIARFTAPPGEYMVIVWTPDYQPIYLNVTAIGLGITSYNTTIPAGLLKIHVRGPDGGPVVDYYVEGESPTYYYFDGYTDVNGTLTVYLPAGTYTIYPHYYSENFTGIEVNVTAGSTTETTINLSLVLAYINTTFDQRAYIYLVLSNDPYNYNYIYTATDYEPVPIYLTPGHYVLELPGINTSHWGRYGYGEQVKFTINESEIKIVRFNLTAIALRLETLSMLPRNIYAKLYSQVDTSIDEYITTCILRYDQSPSTYMLVTPGTYAVVLYGPPYSYKWSYWGVAGHSYTWYNVSATMDNIPFLEYEMGLAIIRINTSDSSLSIPPTRVDVYALYNGDLYEVYLKYTDTNGYTYFYLTEGTYVASTPYGTTVFNVTRGGVTYVTINASFIEVYLKGPDGEPVINTLVNLYTNDTMLITYGYTDEYGRVLFAVQPGNYTIVLKGLNYYYSPYNGGLYNNINLGYGLARNVELFPNNSTTVIINLSRIDIEIGCPLSGADDLAVLLYDNVSMVFINSMLTNTSGKASFYVTNGSYRILLLGYSHGWSDRYYIGAYTWYSAGYGADLGSVNISGLVKAYFTYNISAVYVFLKTFDNEPVIAQWVTVYSSDQVELREGSVNSDGELILYLTQGSYYIAVYPYDQEPLNITSIGIYYYNKTFSKIRVTIRAPPSIITTYTEYVRILFYKDYVNSSSRGTYITSNYVAINETITTYILVNTSAAVIIPGYRSLGYTSTYGYGDVRLFTANTSIIDIIFNMSRLTIRVEGPWGPINGILTYISPTEAPYGYTYEWTDSNGYAEFLITEGNYFYWTYVIPYTHRDVVYVDAYTAIERNISLGAIRIVHDHHPDDSKFIRIIIYDDNYGYLSYLTIYDEQTIYTYNGTYHLVSRIDNGWIIERNVTVQELNESIAVFPTGMIRIHLFNVENETIMDSQVARLNLREDSSIGDQVRIIYFSNGVAVEGALTPGNYTITFPYYYANQYGYTRLYNVSVYALQLTDYVIKLGRLQVNLLYNNGTPAANYEVKVYTTWSDGSIQYLIDSKYTDDNGTVVFDLTRGEYALWLEGLGYVYGITLYDGRLTNVTYTVSPADLTVTNITWSPKEPGDGDIVLVTANITNLGPGHVFNDFRVRFYLNGTLVKTVEVHGLLAGYYVLVTTPITAIGGIDEISVIVDAEKTIFDSNRTNNNMTAYIRVLKPDLLVLNASIDGELVDGGRARITFNITNLGPGNTHRTFYVRVLHEGRLVRTLSVNGLDVNDTIELSAEFTVIGGDNEVTIIIDPDNDIGEENETNNIYVLTFYAPPPDLAIISANMSYTDFIDGGLALLNVTISNIGAAKTYRAFFVKLFIDGEYVSSAYYSGGLDVGETINLIFYMLLRGGVHTITVIIDPDHRIPDPDRDNNVYTINYTLPAPDLSVENLTVEPSIAGEGEEVTVAFTVANKGAGGTKTKFYVDLYVDGVPYDTTYIDTPLMPSDNVTRSFVLALSAGNHTLEIIVDPTEKTGDINRTNNNATIIVTILSSDIEVVSLEINTSGGLHYSAEAEVKAVIRNNGPGSINKTFYVSFFDNDEFIRQVAVNSLAVGENITITIPIALTSGNRTFKVIADDHYMVCPTPGVCIYKHRHEISDLDRGNNNASIRIYVPGPDLIITNITIDPSVPKAWGNFTVYLTIKNIGDYKFNDTLDILLSIGNNNYLIHAGTILEPGDEITVAKNIYEGLMPGNHSIKAVVDIFNAIIELNESNNDYTTILSIPLPDIEITRIHVNASQVLNNLDVYNITITIRNNGWSFNHFFYIVVKLGNVNWYIKRVVLEGEFSTGEEKNVTIQLFARPPGGQEYVVYADFVNTIPESNESNNIIYFTTPLVRSLDISEQTYTLWYTIVEESRIRIVNTGGVPLELVNITFNEPWITIDYNSTIVLAPGEHIDLEMHVNTSYTGIGSFPVVITIETNTSYSMTEEIYVRVIDPDLMFRVSTSQSYVETSLTGIINLAIHISSSFYPTSNYTVRFSGNATVMMTGSQEFMVSRTGAYGVCLNASPLLITPGKYVLEVEVTIVEYNISKRMSINITIYEDPIIIDIMPMNNTFIPSNTLVIAWRTNVPTNGTLYFREVGEQSFIEIPYDKDVKHEFHLGGLLVNHSYEFYIVAETDAGSVTTKIYRITVLPSVGFKEHEVTVRIRRDYMQVVTIDVVNNDKYFSHAIVAWIANPYPDLILNFVGSGSIDKELRVSPESTARLQLVIHAADTVATNYTITAILVNLDNNATDVMTIHIIIEEPVFDIRLEYLGMDNYTLVQVYKLTNYGDTITDLSVYLVGPISAYAYVYPDMNHILIKHGETIIFYVIPILSQLPEDPNLVVGTIVVETKDPRNIEFKTDYFKPPEGYKIYRVMVESITIRAKANDWYCTNRPRVTTKLRISSDPPDDTGTATLYITFLPKSDVLPHDGQILVNGAPVYSWSNDVPRGVVAVEVPLSVLNLNPSGGISEVTIEINTEHMNGGHYVVATGFELLVNVKGGVYYVAAKNYEEAREKVYSIFKPNLVHIDPIDCETIQKPPALIKAIVGTLKSGISLDIGEITSFPDLIKGLLGSFIEVDAKIEGSVAETLTTIDITLAGKLELKFATEIVRGEAYGKLGWAIMNCEWKFTGGTLGGSLKYGKTMPFPLPKTWLSYINKHGVKVNAEVLIGVSNVVIKIDERLSIVAIPSFLIGIETSGIAELELSEDTKLKITFKLTGDIGWEDNNPTGKIAVSVAGDVSLEFGPWEYTYSGEWGVKFLARYNVAAGKWEWGVRPLSDPGATTRQYYFYADQLGYPYIVLADQYSSSNPSLSYMPGVGLVAVWIASNENTTKIMYSVYNGSSWSEPSQIPAPDGPWYISVETSVVSGKLVVLVTAIDPFDPTNMTYEEVAAILENKTLYYTIWDGNTWSTLTAITHGVAGLLDTASTGEKILAVWKTIVDDKEAITYSIMEAMSWTSPSILTSTIVDNETLSIRSIAAVFMDDKPVIVWTRDIYRNETGSQILLYTGMYYIMYENSTWSQPELVENVTDPISVDAVSNQTSLYVIWSSEEDYLYVIAFNGTSWLNNTVIGRGSLPTIAFYNNTIAVLARSFYNTTYTDVSMYIVGLETLSSTTIQHITVDELEDNDYDVEYYNGEPIPIWTRRYENTSDLPEGYVYAYGLYYVKPVEIAITGFKATPTATIEGNPISVEVNITNRGEDNATFNILAYLNDTLVYNQRLSIVSDTTITHSFNVTPIDKGVYVLRVVVADSTPPNILGEPEASAIINSTRLLEVTTPANMSFVENTTRITGVVKGLVPANVTVYIIEEEERTPIASLGFVIGEWEAPLNTTTLSDGPVKILVEASTGGAIDSCTLVLLVDNTPPTINFITPTNNSFVAREIAINVTAYDEYYSLPNIPFYRINNSTWTPMQYLDNNTYYILVDTRNHTDGIPLIIEVNTTDLSGKTTVEKIVLIPDNTPPETIDNTTTAWLNRDVTIVLDTIDNVSGIAETFYRVDGGEWISGTIILIQAFANHSNDGVHVVEYYSIDNVGNVEPVKTAYVYVDTTPPTMSVEGLYNDSYVKNSVLINGIVSDELSGVAFVTISIDGSEPIEIEPVNDTWSYLLDTTIYGDGLHQMTVTVIDNAGNNYTTTIEFNIDNTPPTATFTAPQPNSVVSRATVLEFSYSDDNIDKAILIINGTSIDVTGRNNYTIDTTIYPDGALVVMLNVSDKAGNYHVTNVTVIIDNTPPTATIVSPASYTLVSGTTTIEFTYNDTNFYKAILYINNIEYNVTGRNNYTIDTSLYTDGYLNITLKAVDLAGNTNTSSIIIVVDNTPPQVTIMSPSNGTKVESGILAVSWNIIEPHLDKAILYIDGEPVDVTSISTYNIDVDSLTLGVHTITLYAVDKLGHESNTTIVIEKIEAVTTTTTTTTAETTTTTTPPGFTIGTAVAITVLVLLAIALILLLRRGKLLKT